MIIAIPLSIIVGNSLTQYLLLIGSILLVMITELLNSAIENVNDRIGTEYHTLCERAKDQSSAAVLVSIILALFTWIVILVENF